VLPNAVAMNGAGDASALDQQVRSSVFDGLMRNARPPSFDELATRLGRAAEDIRESFRRLAGAHVFILQDTGDLMAANPFAAIPTPFRVAANGRNYSAMCIWDSLGIPAMLNTDAEVRTTCGDCNTEMVLAVRDGELQRVDGMAHFAVPAKQWWQNIVYS
jgi:hypothetical protein